MKKITLIPIFAGLFVLCGVGTSKAETVSLTPELIGHVIATSDDGAYEVEVWANENNKPTGLVAIPEETVIGGKTYRVTEIAESGFSGCEMTMVTLPPTLHKIGKLAFYNCFNLTNVVECTHGSVETLSIDSFRNTKSLESVYFPSVVYIPSDSFYGSGLVSADFPAACVIGARAFYECKNLGSVTMSPDLNTIEANAFLSCFSLKYIKLTHKLQTIGVGAFNFCYSMDFIVIPAGVKSIGLDAFNGCAGLKEVYLLNPDYSPEADDSKLLKNKNIETVYCVNRLKKFLESYYKDSDYAPEIRLMKEVVKPTVLSISDAGYRFTLSKLVDNVSDIKVSPSDDIYSYLSMDSEGTYYSPINNVHLEYSIGAWKPMWYDEILETSAGVESVISDMSKPSVAVNGSVVTVNCAEGAQIDIYTLQGVRVGGAYAAGGRAEIGLSHYIPGVYLVKVGSEVTKVCLN